MARERKCGKINKMGEKFENYSYIINGVGGIDISWRRQDNTESETFGYLIDTDDCDFDDEVPWAEENPNL